MEEKDSIKNTAKAEEVEKQNTDICRTKIHKVYVKETKKEEKTTRGGRFGIRER